MTEPMNPSEIAAMVADTNTDYRKAMLYHSDRADAFMAERDELAAAIDSIETSNGLTSNGNLWRFWVKKSQELLDKNKVLSAQLTTLQREAVTQARHDVKIYAMTADRDYDRRQTAHLQTVVDKLNAHISAMTAERDAAVARVKMVTDLVEWACDTLTEINPSNYGHDDVCRLNDRSVKVIIGLSALTEGTPT